MSRVFKVLVAVGLFLCCFAFETEAANLQNEFSLGYELTDGVDPGGLTYSLNMGYGYKYDQENQIRFDFIHQYYKGVSWDASVKYWPNYNKSEKDTSSTLTAFIVSLRPYIFSELPKDIKVFLQLGLGYYVMYWEDIHPSEGHKYLIAPVIGIGFQYMLFDRLAIGLELKEHIFNRGDFKSGIVTISTFF